MKIMEILFGPDKGKMYDEMTSMEAKVKDYADFPLHNKYVCKRCGIDKDNIASVFCLKCHRKVGDVTQPHRPRYRGGKR